MSGCNKAGVRVYPVLKRGMFKLVVEFNKTDKFLKKDIKKIKEGDEKYNPHKSKWVCKTHELYKYFYEKSIQPKSEKNELPDVA